MAREATEEPEGWATPGGVLAFAHRGGAYHPEIEGLENTLAAFKHAVALGYDYLETDVHVTADGVLLAFHDSVLDRVTDQKGAISDLTLRGGTPRAGRRPGAGADPGPAVRRVPGGPLQHRPEVGRRGRRRSPTSWRSGTPGTGSSSARSAASGSDAFRRLTDGRVPTSAAPLEVVLFRFLPSGRLADRLTGRKVAALQIPHRRGRLTIASRGLVRRAHAAGRPVHVWTVDDPDEMRQLLDRGVDGIFTDRTDVLKDVLTERGNWRESAQHDDH